MIHAKIGDPTEIQRIDEQLSKAEKKNWYRRLMIIKLSATQQLNVPELGRMFSLSAATVSQIYSYLQQSGIRRAYPSEPSGTSWENYSPDPSRLR